jgi:hypothetical protein
VLVIILPEGIGSSTSFEVKRETETPENIIRAHLRFRRSLEKKSVGKSPVHILRRSVSQQIWDSMVSKDRLGKGNNPQNVQESWQSLENVHHSPRHYASDLANTPAKIIDITENLHSRVP